MQATVGNTEICKMPAKKKYFCWWEIKTIVLWKQHFVVDVRCQQLTWVTVLDTGHCLRSPAPVSHVSVTPQLSRDHSSVNISHSDHAPEDIITRLREHSDDEKETTISRLLRFWWIVLQQLQWNTIGNTRVVDVNCFLDKLKWDYTR